MQKLLINPYILAIAVIYGFWQTAFFGWNALPSSDAEIVCDGITVLILALAFRGK